MTKISINIAARGERRMEKKRRLRENS